MRNFMESYLRVVYNVEAERVFGAKYTRIGSFIYILSYFPPSFCGEYMGTIGYRWRGNVNYIETRSMDSGGPDSEGWTYYLYSEDEDQWYWVARASGVNPGEETEKPHGPYLTRRLAFAAAEQWRGAAVEENAP